MRGKKKFDPDRNYSPTELNAMLDKMEAASNAFYGMAFQIGNHAFVEFTGLMNEYIVMCRKAVADGVDFTNSNVHGGKPLFDMAPHNAAYMGEKFGCIFATTFAGKPKLIEAFIRAAFNVSASVGQPVA